MKWAWDIRRRIFMHSLPAYTDWGCLPNQWSDERESVLAEFAQTVNAQLNPPNEIDKVRESELAECSMWDARENGKGYPSGQWVNAGLDIRIGMELILQLWYGTYITTISQNHRIQGTKKPFFSNWVNSGTKWDANLRIQSLAKIVKAERKILPFPLRGTVIILS